MKNINSVDQILVDLKERAKELNCLYEIQEIFSEVETNLDKICNGIIKVIPPGWQYPEVCSVKINYLDVVFKSDNLVETEWFLKSNIKLQDEEVGTITVYYTEERPFIDEGPFLKEERKLIDTISEQFGSYLLHIRLKSVFEEQAKLKTGTKTEWGAVIDLLNHTDPKLLIRISRKMVNFLCWGGIKEAEQLLERFHPHYDEKTLSITEVNRPYQRQPESDLQKVGYEIFHIASKHLSEKEILNNIQKWIKEDSTGFFINTLENAGSSLTEISSAIERFHHLSPQGLELSIPRKKSFMVALIRRILSDQPGFIGVASKFFEIDDFNELVQNIISPTGSYGKVGGKSAGLFLANNILAQSIQNEKFTGSIKTPKTWYITSDSVLRFMQYNNLEDVIEQKYKDIGQVRQEYPYVIHVFKNSSFPPEIIRGLSSALDDLGNVPLIVRSSSLLEDRLGAAFAGKYKSLFIANQGPKKERLVALMDAIAEVYASTFGPDPIEYRKEQGLLDYHEEMGIMIQEVVGKKIGKYYFPAFAGVALSHNEFRWSNRINRSDGLVRIVPGLGTRAVDRLSDDYPILFAPGQSNLRVNVSIDEIIRYSPKYIDVIDLESSKFITLDFETILKENGKDYPYINNIISILRENHIQQPRALGTDYTKENCIATFEGLISNTSFAEQIHTILGTLQEQYDHPIDIEFAHDGKDFYLLQCRSQSYGMEYKPVSIPENISAKNMIFSANRYISNGSISNITHLVYVDPQRYGELPDYQELLKVGRVIGKLNKILPKRQFILMGPGRWGSRGDIKLGVSVTYSDINNTSMLIEIARKQKDYVPDLSFGTHFFQDLVEANIRYLPLYPDETGIIFNEKFLINSNNVLSDMLPDHANLSNVIRVIDIPTETNGSILQILMNAEIEKAVGILTERSEDFGVESSEKGSIVPAQKTDAHWRWRQRNVEGLASRIDPKKFGVKGMYVFGSTKNATAGPSSDIDILIHFIGTEKQHKELLTWLDGWSQSLSQMNYLRTGYVTNGLLDIHIITDEDIEKRTSYALKIGAVTDAARPLAIGTKLKT